MPNNGYGMIAPPYNHQKHAKSKSGRTYDVPELYFDKVIRYDEGITDKSLEPDSIVHHFYYHNNAQHIRKYVKVDCINDIMQEIDEGNVKVSSWCDDLCEFVDTRFKDVPAPDGWYFFRCTCSKMVKEQRYQVACVVQKRIEEETRQAGPIIGEHKME